MSIYDANIGLIRTGGHFYMFIPLGSLMPFLFENDFRLVTTMTYRYTEHSISLIVDHF